MITEKLMENELLLTNLSYTNMVTFLFMIVFVVLIFSIYRVHLCHGLKCLDLAPYDKNGEVR